MNKKIAIISCILEEPEKIQKEFNDVVSNFKEIIKARMGVPFIENNISVISITVIASINEINNFTRNLKSLNNVLITTTISEKNIK